MCKSPLLIRWNQTCIIGENFIKCWLSVNTSKKLTFFDNCLHLKKKIRQYFCLEDIYSGNKCADLGDSKSAKISSTYPL